MNNNHKLQTCKHYNINEKEEKESKQNLLPSNPTSPEKLINFATKNREKFKVHFFFPEWSKYFRKFA